MKNDIAINVDHVSKKYCKSLKHSMLYGIADIGRNSVGLSSHPDYLRYNEFWALDDVSFTLKKGETLGIIGPNGSGKSTLLKMLNGIFWPDKGKISIYGRIGALIEVGAGFHPMLTGRENIYINGAILGMTKKELDAKLDDIIKFADIGDFIDSPVKHYSSGMYVRLGFAIAAHCDPEVLLVDEVLSVGDLKFQSKCQKFITDNILEKGCSVIFVSHNRYSIQDLCNRTLYLNKGKVRKIGNTNEVIEEYLNDVENDLHNEDSLKVAATTPIHSNQLTRVVCSDSLGNIKEKFFSGEKVQIRIYYSFSEQLKKPSIGISLFHNDSRFIISSSTDYIFNMHSAYDGLSIETLNKEGYFEVTIENLYLPVGKYQITAYLFADNKINLLQKFENAAVLEVLWPDESTKRSLIELPHKWTLVEGGSNNETY